MVSNDEDENAIDEELTKGSDEDLGTGEGR